MKYILFSLMILTLLVSCESAKNIKDFNFKNIRKECPENKKLTDLLCKNKETK